MSTTQRNRVKRSPKRGHYDKETINSILDKSYLCHVSFIYEGYPMIIPTLYGRKDDYLFLHGATSSRMLKSIENNQISIAITEVNGLVLARSAYHHSMNYESVVLFGEPELVPDEKKEECLKIISDQMLVGRWKDVRPPNSKELKATSVLCLKIGEASAKIRKGPPIDEKEDYNGIVWAGVVPVKTIFGRPERDDSGMPDIGLPSYLFDIND